MAFKTDIISSELREFEVFFQKTVKTEVSLIDHIMKLVIKKKGKQMRPMFVLLSSKMNGSINQSTYVAAALVELSHTASLVHDDVVDESYERRGFFSLNALWNKKVAVLIGDFLLTQALLVAVNNKEFKHLEYLTEAVKQMSEGELLQIEKSRTLNLSEETYFKIIRGKTASLLSAACAVGAYSANKNEDEASVFQKFGEKVGIAFQIRDDLFDYGTNDVGKPTGNDIKERKITLPLIYTINNVDKPTKAQIINIIKNKNTDTKSIKYVIDVVTQTGGLKYAQEKMIEYCNEAKSYLCNYEDSETKKALFDLVDYTIYRKK